MNITKDSDPLPFIAGDIVAYNRSGEVHIGTVLSTNPKIHISGYHAYRYCNAVIENCVDKKLSKIKHSNSICVIHPDSVNFARKPQQQTVRINL